MPLAIEASLPVYSDTEDDEFQSPLCLLSGDFYSLVRTPGCFP